MSANNQLPTEFEQHTRAVLEESLTRIDGRVRSRLNQARNAALEEVSKRRRSFWRAPGLVPATGAVAAAALVALVLMQHRGERALPAGDSAPAEDIELLADAEGLDLVENWDDAFYEWAAGQAETAGEASG
jgi:anti-sigma-K factor RskA